MLHDIGATFRLREPEETLRVIAPYIKKAGITRIADLTTLDAIGIPVYTCLRPNSKNLATSQGKGINHALAMCSAYMEGIEHFYAESPAVHQVGGYHSLKAQFDCVNPEILPKGSYQGKALTDIELRWTKTANLKNNDAVYLPTDYLSFDFTSVSPLDAFVKKTTTGLASGNSELEATCHSLFEIIERHDTAMFRTKSPDEFKAAVIDLETIDYLPAQQLLARLKEESIGVSVCDMRQHENAIPSFFAIFCDQHPLRKLPNFSGYGAHSHQGVALCRALNEAAQSRLTFIAGSRDDVMPREYHRQWQNLILPGVKDYRAIHAEMPDGFEALQAQLLQRINRDQILKHVYTTAEDAISVVHCVVPELLI